MAQASSPKEKHVFLPSDIQRLTVEELYTVGAAIPDGPRDALYILREVLRRGIDGRTSLLPR
jgi:hypothetical protein